jgi:MarR family transcriptional regulator, organic hydroperoxide resistance regulator
MAKLIPVKTSDPLSRAFLLFTRVAGIHLRFVDSMTREIFGLSRRKYLVLIYLMANQGSMNHSELASWTNTKKNNITVVINNMKREHLVTTERDEADRRIINITITDEGRCVYNSFVPKARLIYQRIMLGFSGHDALEFERLLNMINANLENDSPEALQ